MSDIIFNAVKSPFKTFSSFRRFVCIFMWMTWFLCMGAFLNTRFCEYGDGLGVLTYLYYFLSGASFFVGFISLILRQWRYGLGLILLTPLLAIIFTLWAGVNTMFQSSDCFADDLEIPVELGLVSTHEEGNGYAGEVDSQEIFKDRRVEFVNIEHDSASQEGFYRYRVGLRKTPPGRIYMKAFEVTKEIPLTAKRMTRETLLEVDGQGTEHGYALYEPQEEFMIGEGDWGKPYAARFELWFENDETGQEELLYSRHAIVVGWMR